MRDDMFKLYAEYQYKTYYELMQKLAKTNDIVECVKINRNIEEWIIWANISEYARKQMDMRIEEEIAIQDVK